MSEFRRRLIYFEKLRELASERDPNWWTDLLGLWRPSGSPAGEHGLRLAIRDNYLNLYSRGQSVALVKFARDGRPYAETHIKYAFGCNETEQAYARLDGTAIKHPRSGKTQTYSGFQTLQEWIKRSDEYKTDEKTCVDELIAANPTIIDVEIGLPATSDRRTAPRMDCVALEEDGGEVHIVFWEAKMIDSPELRSQTEPRIKAQLEQYRSYLHNTEEAGKLEQAYRNVCRLLLQIHGLAARPDLPVLHPLVIEAADDRRPLRVDPEPRLVIFGGKYQKKGNWAPHHTKLVNAKIPVLVFQDEPYRLRKPEARA